MTVVETHIGGRRAAARDAAETRKKIVLAVLAVVLLALLAFELPKIMKSLELVLEHRLDLPRHAGEPGRDRSAAARRSRLQTRSACA